MTLSHHRSILARPAALLLVVVLALLAPFSTLCVGSGHTGIEFLFATCCGDEDDADDHCADGCTDAPADFGASLGASLPPAMPAARHPVPLSDQPPSLDVHEVQRLFRAAAMHQHAALATVILLI